MAITVIALIVVGIIATVAFVLQMSLIQSGGWKRVNRKATIAASLVFATAIATVFGLWGILFTQLSIDVGGPVGVVLAIVTIVQLAVLLSSLYEATKSLMKQDESMSFAEVVEQSVKR